jgi:hypothetical protein
MLLYNGMDSSLTAGIHSPCANNKACSPSKDYEGDKVISILRLLHELPVQICTVQ